MKSLDTFLQNFLTSYHFSTMYKTLIIAFLVVATISARAQSKHLPEKTVITLSPQQVLRIDSAVRIMADKLDSKSQTQWFIASFDVLYKQVREQMVADSVKGVKK